MKNVLTVDKSIFLFVGAIVLLGFVPFAWISANTVTIYVDQDASGTADGSKAHPYTSISDALDHADDGTYVRIGKGTYKENIRIPKGVKVEGIKNHRGDVVIDGNDKKPTIEMKHGAELRFVTVKDGRYGIHILGDSKVHIYDVLVRDAERDGIYIDAAKRVEKYRALMDKIEVKDNGRAGIYSEKRLTVIVNSDIHDNRTDGIDFQAGVKAWLEDDKVYENKATGWKVVLDGADIWTKNNDFRRNGREGIQVESFGLAGAFGLKGSKEVDNGRHGVAIVARNASALSMWKNIFITKNSAFGNKLTQVSSVLLVK
jgi:pectin methylesterase-like acyl-CoA thioesterase